MYRIKSKDYQRKKLELTLLTALLELVALFVFLYTGLNVALRNLVISLVGIRFLIDVPVYLLCIALVHEILFFSFSYLKGFRLEQHYNLSNQNFSQWLKDHIKAASLGWIIGIIATALVYLLLRQYPENWWWLSAFVLWLGYIFLVKFAPLFIFPLFFKFKPLEHESLEQNILSMAESTGIHVKGVFEFDMSRKTKSANAAITGLGSTCRILLADNLLSHYSPEEISAVIAHELGHHKYNHLIKGIAINLALLLLFLFAGNRAILWGVEHFQLQGPGDIATFPLLCLVFSVGGFVFLPVTNTILRSFERSADRFALETTKDPDSFISMMEKLSDENLADPRPHPLVEFLFHSHPNTHKRIEFARQSGLYKEKSSTGHEGFINHNGKE